MLREDYVSDNPFRLLDLSTKEGYNGLRRGADAVERSAQVGLAAEVPLKEQFGEELDGVASRIRALATDPELASVYRFFWVMNQDEVSDLTEICRSPKTISADGHFGFLANWYSFLQFRRPVDLRQTVDHLAQLSADETFMKSLMRPLIEEGLSEIEAEAAVNAAVITASCHVGVRSFTFAAREWEIGEKDVAKRFIEIAQQINVAEVAIEAALWPIVKVGDDQEWALEQEPIPHGFHIKEPSSRCYELEDLARLVGNHPKAELWRKSASQHRSRLANSVRVSAMEVLGQRGDVHMALWLVERAKELRPSDELMVQLAEDSQVLEERWQAVKKRAWEEILPMEGAPTVKTTYNGFGFRLIEKEPFAGDPNLVFAVQYFTVYWIPVLPVARFLGRFEPDYFRFHGRARWSTEMKLHVAAILVLVGGLVVSGISEAMH